MISSIRFAAAPPPAASSQPSAAAAAPSAPLPGAPTPAPKTTKDYNFVRKGIEGVAGVAGGFVGTALNTIPSAIAGGLQGINRNSYAEDVGTAETLLLVLETTVGGAVAGGLTAGGLGVAVGLGIGLVGGIALAGLQHTSKGAEQIGSAIKDKVDVAVSDNVPSGSKTKDVTKDFTEGSIVGALSGGKASFSVGKQEASGAMSGLLEGTAGAFHVFTGKYDPAAPPATKESRGIISSILRIPRVLVRTGVGVVIGGTSAALNAVDGTVQGFVQGASKDYYGDKKVHNAFMRIELLAAGITVGAFAAGPLGGVAGAIGGLIAGTVVSRLNRRTGADQACVDYVSNCVKGAADDNAQSDSKIYTTFRDGIEGGLVGTAAGVKAGFYTGYEGGKGAVDGVFDGVKGVIDGIIGAFKPTPKPPQSGQPSQPPTGSQPSQPPTGSQPSQPDPSTPDAAQPTPDPSTQPPAQQPAVQA